MDKKSTQKSIKKMMPPGIGFGKDFGGFWEGKWSQPGTKKETKASQIEPRWGPQTLKSSQNGAKMEPRRPQNRKIIKTQQGRGEHLTPLPHFYRKSTQHGPNLGPKLEPK